MKQFLANDKTEVVITGAKMRSSAMENNPWALNVMAQASNVCVSFDCYLNCDR